jgi:hypothetical protein
VIESLGWEPVTVSGPAPLTVKVFDLFVLSTAVAVHDVPEVDKLTVPPVGFVDPDVNEALAFVSDALVSRTYNS